jgi:hypothetical protein
MRLVFLTSLLVLIVSAQVADSAGTRDALEAKINAPKPSNLGCGDRAYRQFEKPLPTGHACEEELLARRGRPFMFPARNGIAFGVSSESGKPSSLNLWVDNQRDESQSIYVCCADLFKWIDVYDSAAHRVPSRWDELKEKLRSEGREYIEGVCTCSGDHLIPPHTIQIVDYSDLSMAYSLAAGHYTITERQASPKKNDIPGKKQTDRVEGLSISLSHSIPGPQ